MKITKTSLPGVVVLEPTRHGDTRGFFSETWNRQTLLSRGYDYDFVQDNQSLSTEVNTVRGLHFQAPPFGQAKLVRCGQGAIFDVAVDIRKGSPTFQKWIGVTLTPENGRQLLIPVGFLHGFATTAPNTEVLYKCSASYHRASEGAVRFDDPDLGIDWGLSGPVTVSEKDAAAALWTAFDSPFDWTPA